MSIHKRIWKHSTHKPPEVSSPNSAAPLFAASRIRWIGDGKSVKGPVEKCLPELLAQLPGANLRLGAHNETMRTGFFIFFQSRQIREKKITG